MGRYYGRIGSFNPSLQGPVEPPSSLSSYIEIMESDLEEDLEAEAKSLGWIETYHKQIEDSWKAIAKEKERLHRLRGTIREAKEFIENATQDLANLESEKGSLVIQVELLLEDPGNEEKVKALETRIKEINNRL